MRNTYLWTFIVFTLAFFSVNSVTATTIRVNPERITNVNKDDTFTINVEVENVEDLFGFQFYLKYDPTVLYPVNGDGDININFLENLEGNGWRASLVYHEQGYLIVYATYLAERTKSGSGTLATITFKVQKTGYSALHLYETLLLGEDAATHNSIDIPHTLIDSYFDNTGNTEGTTTPTVTTPTTTPLPTTSITSSYLQWSNLRNEPSRVTTQNPVNIFVDWYDLVGLKTVIISENSTGKWIDHIVYGG